jgi:hypothetical protein
VYLDTKTEDPTSRKFKRDILPWTVEHRGEIVTRLLTITSAYLAYLDAEDGPVPMGGHATRFPTWDRMVRQALMWAGAADVGEKIAQAQEADPEREQLAAFLDAWPWPSGKRVAAGDMVAKVSELGDPAFTGALRDIVDAGSRVLDARKVGIVLKKFANRRIATRTLKMGYDSHKKRHEFWVE